MEASISQPEPSQRPHKVSQVAVHPKRSDIEADLAKGLTVRSVAQKYGVGEASLYVYARRLKRANNPSANGTQESLTVDRAKRLMRDARLHMKAALASGDLKAANGAISSATKAIELFGKASGELKTGGDITITLSQSQQAAVDAHEQASVASASEVTAQAATWLHAQVLAGAPEAIAAVRRLASLDATATG